MAQFSAFRAAVVLIPEKNVGFSIEINSEDGGMILGLMYELLDHYLGLPKGDWPEKMIDLQETNDGGGVEKISDRFRQAGRRRPVTST